MSKKMKNSFILILISFSQIVFADNSNDTWRCDSVDHPEFQIEIARDVQTDSFEVKGKESMAVWSYSGLEKKTISKDELVFRNLDARVFIRKNLEGNYVGSITIPTVEGLELGRRISCESSNLESDGESLKWLDAENNVLWAIIKNGAYTPEEATKRCEELNSDFVEARIANIGNLTKYKRALLKSPLRDYFSQDLWINLFDFPKMITIQFNLKKGKQVQTDKKLPIVCVDLKI